MKLSFFAMACVALATPSWAATSTTVGTLTLASTFDSISVTATYTNDDNANNSATLQFRPTGSSTWRDAYYPAAGTNNWAWPDRRATANGLNNAAHQSQFRGSIVDLVAGQTYDVKVTMSDADGVTGADLTASVTLLSDATIVRSGATYYLDDVGVNGNGSSGSPFNSIANAMAGSSCGDKIVVNDGTYAAGTISKTCTATTWFVFECNSNVNGIVSEGTGTTPNLTISGDYVQVKNCRFASSSDSVIELTNSPSHVWLEGNYLVDAGTDVAANECDHATRYGEGAIVVGSGSDNIWIIRNTILGTHLSSISGCISSLWSSSLSGIWWLAGTVGNHVMKNNTIIGGFRDCIGGSPENETSSFANSDVLGNTVRGCKDDGIQLEASDINLRVGRNTVIVGDVADGDASWGWSALATQTGFFSPIYIWRNYFRYSSTNGGAIYKGGGLQGAYIFHNTIDSEEDGMAADSTTNSIWMRNNIMRTTANTIYQLRPTGTALDYDLYYKPSGTNIISQWNGVTDYTTTAGFYAGEGQEQHGTTGDPLINRTTGTITSSSPAYNAGITLANFNDTNSACAALNGTPDMGAFEVGGCASTGSSGGFDVGGSVSTPASNLTATIIDQDTAEVRGVNCAKLTTSGRGLVRRVTCGH